MMYKNEKDDKRTQKLSENLITDADSATCGVVIIIN